MDFSYGDDSCNNLYRSIDIMYSVFTSQTGTIGPNFTTVKDAEKYARKLGINAQIFNNANPTKVVKWIFKKQRG